MTAGLNMKGQEKAKMKQLSLSEKHDMFTSECTCHLVYCTWAGFQFAHSQERFPVSAEHHMDF